MKRLCVLFIVLCSFLPAIMFAQELPAPKHSEFAALPPFYCDILSMGIADSVHTRVELFLQVPYNQIHFVKVGEKFHGEYTFSVSIMDSSKKVVLERTWTDKISAQSFQETMTKNNFNLARKVFQLSPGEYQFKLLFEDKESRQQYNAEARHTVRNLQKGVKISDLLFIASGNPLDGGKILPNVSRIVHTRTQTIPYYFEIFSDSAKNINVVSELYKGKERVARVSRPMNLKSGRNQVLSSIDSVFYGSGDYMLSVELTDLNSAPPLNYVKKSFTIKLSGLPFVIHDLDKAVEQLMYLASHSELDSLKNAKSYDEKLARFMQFWKKRDPNEATEENEVFNEYYRRIEFANKNFSHYVEGWKSDMGMVYILLGPPNNVDRHPFDYDRKPYEIWEYYELNKSFVFVDNLGFGDYRLLEPLSGDELRYR
ncbi:MAG: GWxTD domain-containing protein [Ignavibacteria bacterium]|nr:GWxTD domain-containing protein [Ignavibacteria bacterium]